MAAFEAVGYAKFTGRPGVCVATSGPGAIHLLNGLYDAKLDHVPVVAIVGQTARSAMGGNYQQEVDLLSLFKDVASAYVQMATVPWLDEQGQSSFVWSVIGTLSQATSLPITTAVTCPLVRTHPLIIAQAAATSAAMTDFTLGVGTGEALNEHIVGSRWPPADERLEMLQEAIMTIRRMFTGELVTHRGKHYDSDTARLYTLPDRPPPIYMSGFGNKAAELAGFLTPRRSLRALNSYRSGKSHQARLEIMSPTTHGAS
jgi:hypothetical protein